MLQMKLFEGRNLCNIGNISEISKEDTTFLIHDFFEFCVVFFFNFLSLLISIKKESEVPQSCLTLCDPMDHSLPCSSKSMGFSRQEYWSGLPFPSPGDLNNPGIKAVYIAGRRFTI